MLSFKSNSITYLPPPTAQSTTTSSDCPVPSLGPLAQLSPANLTYGSTVVNGTVLGYRCLKGSAFKGSELTSLGIYTNISSVFDERTMGPKSVINYTCKDNSWVPNNFPKCYGKCSMRTAYLKYCINLFLTDQTECKKTVMGKEYLGTNYNTTITGKNCVSWVDKVVPAVSPWLMKYPVSEFILN
jgi:hypothetical protein